MLQGVIFSIQWWEGHECLSLTIDNYRIRGIKVLDELLVGSGKVVTGKQAIGEITGRITPDDLLGSIFSRFCIGK